MALQPDAKSDIDRTQAAPFLLRLFWRQNRPLEAWEFSVAPPADTSTVADYTSILPSNIRQQSVQVFTWPNCTLRELAGLFVPIIPNGAVPVPAVGTRLVFKLIFPDTRATVIEGNRGKWIDKPLGSVVIGGAGAELIDGEVNIKDKEDLMASLTGEADKSLAEARFVIGDYVAVSIYPPGPDGRVVPVPPTSSRGPPGRDMGPRGPPPPRENGYGGGYGRGGGGYRGGYGPRGGGFGAAPPPGDWRRGERPPSAYDGPRGYRGRGGRPY
ncbi:Hypothetical predicted protein [Lecanosticta acicola]|uniref:Uncharacterized protein n=1 Tax=Lecanosticta acicola TaxID=111012 RepID=A0AAI9E9T5_9PEZI|nr:Hypothetical predicted protein [Lecanosticta acicola]